MYRFYIQNIKEKKGMIVLSYNLKLLDIVGSRQNTSKAIKINC